jgi:cell division protein FtsL
MEKVKSFAILILAVSLISSYFMIYQLLNTNSQLLDTNSQLLDTNSKLQNKVYDLESVIRVNEIIKRTGKNGG